MRKLLGILAAMGIMTSTTTTVVACGKNNVKRFSIPTLSEKIRDQILVSLLNYSSLNSITNGKYFNSINFQKAILQMVQDQVSKLSNNYFQTRIADQLQLNKEAKETYETQIDEIASDVARNQFYLEYTKSILNNPAVSKDQELNIGGDGKNLYSLNPQNLLTDETKTGKDAIDVNDYYIYMHETDANGKPNDTNNWVRWQYSRENDDVADNNTAHLPSINQLQNNRFIILKANPGLKVTEVITDANLEDKQELFYKDKNGVPVLGEKAKFYSKDGDKAFEMDGRTALEYRFQEYFTTKLRFSVGGDGDDKSLFENLLTMSYLNSRLFNVSRNENQTQTKFDTFLNISSEVAQTVQTWNKTDGYKSKLKMVWSFTMKDRETVSKSWNAIRTKLNNDGSLKNSSRNTLAEVYKLLETAAGGQNDSNLGKDPFFNFNGYNGLVKNDGEGKVVSVDGNLVVNDAANSKIATASGPSVLTADNKGQGFASNKQNEFDFVLVLPIYLVDLLNDRTGGYDNGQSTTSFARLSDIGEDNKPATLYTGYSQEHTLDKSKLDEIKKRLNQSKNYYIYVDDAPYTIQQFNNQFNQTVSENEIWSQIKSIEIPQKINGVQFTNVNSDQNSKVFGNIGINQEVNLGSGLVKPQDKDNIKFTKKGDDLYVKATDASLVGKVVDFESFKLSFDDGQKDGVYTVQGTLGHQTKAFEGRTYSYRVNMGASASDPNGYVKDGSFDFYRQNVSSLDIANLATAKKNSLLRQISFVTSKESGVADSAASAIYPLFFEAKNILYTPLYEALKKYIVDEGGGSSD